MLRFLNRLAGPCERKTLLFGGRSFQALLGLILVQPISVLKVEVAVVILDEFVCISLIP
jgi:hypothetical protein